MYPGVKIVKETEGKTRVARAENGMLFIAWLHAQPETQSPILKKKACHVAGFFPVILYSNLYAAKLSSPV